MPKLAMDAVRRSNRFRVIMNLPLRIGLKNGTLVDISSAGILATHTGVLKAGTLVEISFQSGEEKFSAKARVASCTVVGLGAGEGGATLYASRLFFVDLPEESKHLLETLVGHES
jgi:hypothetical protein